MSNSKISALTFATIPLAGTETLPVVQSSTTKQVSVANLTAGRAVSASSLTATSGGVSVKGGPTGYGGDEIAMTTTTSTYCAITTQMTGGTMYFDNRGTSNTVDWTWRNGTGAANTRMNLSSIGDLTVNTGNLIQGTAAKGVNFTANTPAAGMTSQLLNWYEEGTWTPTDASGAGLTFTVSGTATYIRIGKLVTVQVFLTFPTTVNTTQALIGGLPFTSAASTYSEASVFTNSGLTFNAYLGASVSSFDFRNNTNTNYTNANLSTKFVVVTLTYRSA